MKASAKVTGVPQLEVRLRHAGERVQDKARKAMYRVAGKIVARAQLFAPVDEHNLEKSIRLERETETRGRLNLIIVMGGFVGGVNVDRYAVMVHENYASMGVGPGTQAKRAANPGVYVGEKFITRAVEENRDYLERYVLEAVTKEWTL